MNRFLTVAALGSLAMTVLVGCGNNRPSSPTGPPGPVVDDQGGSGAPAAAPVLGDQLAVTPAGFADSDLVTFEGAEVVFYSLAGGKPAELARMGFPESLGSITLDGDWVDRDTLALWLSPDIYNDENPASEDAEPRVVRVTAKDAVVLPRPDKTFFAADKPKQDADDGNDIDPDVVEARMIVTAGEIWWAQCPWGYPYDGGECLVWVQARLWPDPARTEGEALVDARGWRWPKQAAPTGHTVKVEEGEESGSVLICSAGGKKVTIASPDEADKVSDSYGVSEQPPQLLVVWGQEGYDDLYPTRWTLHAGCSADPIATGTRVAPGPEGLWMAHQSPLGQDLDEDTPTQVIIRRGATVLGALGEKGREVRFRPPR